MSPSHYLNTAVKANKNMDLPESSNNNFSYSHISFTLYKQSLTGIYLNLNLVHLDYNAGIILD